MTVTVTPAIHVVIQDDLALIKAFLNWQSVEHVFPLRNSGNTVGPTFLAMTFDARDAIAIGEFWQTQGIK